MYIIFPVKIMSDVNVSIQKKIEYMYAIVTMKRIFVEEKSRKYIALYWMKVFSIKEIKELKLY